MNVKKAIIPAAGLATRFLPAAKAVPKEMLPVVDTPTIQYIVEEAVRAGIDEILIITGRNKTAIEDHFDKAYELEDTLRKKGKEDDLEKLEAIWKNVQIHTVRQKEPLGLGHAILKGEAFVGDEPFAVLLGDDVVHAPQKGAIDQLKTVYASTQTSILGVQEVEDSQVHKYGIVQGDKLDATTYKVTGMVEKPDLKDAPSNAAILGRYIITPGIFKHLKETKPGKGGEIQLTDALLALSEEEGMLAHTFTGIRYDVGDKLGFLKAQVEFALRDETLSKAFEEYLRGLLK